MWRVSHLTDIPAMRSAAFAMSRLYMLVGDRDNAVSEAKTLFSLCQSAPVATKEELKKAKAYLRSLGLAVSDGGEVSERKKKASTDPRDELLKLINKGKTQAAMKMLKQLYPGTTAITDFADLTFGTATVTARGCLIYNSSDSNKSVATIDFGGDKTSTAGDFTIVFPAAAASTAIIRIA